MFSSGIERLYRVLQQSPIEKLYSLNTSSPEDAMDSPPVTAHNIMRFMTIPHTDNPEIIGLVEDVRVDLQGKFVRKHLASLAPAILSLLPASKTFCLAARRQNIMNLANFIGYSNLYWVGYVCCMIVFALENSSKCITLLEHLRHASFIDQNKPVLRLDKQLKIIRMVFPR